MADSDIKQDGEEQYLKLRITGHPSTMTTNVEIIVTPHSTVANVKSLVRKTLEASESRYLRLIYKGRLLAPDTARVKDYNVQNGDVVHAVLAAAGVRGGPQAALSRGATRRYRGTGVNASGRVERLTGSEADDDDDDDDTDEEDGRERLGFDRLRASGLSRPEITAIRAYFSRQVDRFVAQHPQPDTEEDLMVQRRRHEDAWMAAQGPASEFRLNLNANNPLLRFPQQQELFRSSVGSDRDFLWGFLLGFFVGFLMLVWVWMPSVSHKQKLGILTGISLQLAMSLLRTKNDEAFDDAY